MRRTVTKVLAVLLMGAAAPLAQAQPGYRPPYQVQAVNQARIVEGWYERYLGRTGDPAGMQVHVLAMNTQPPVVVEASILSSDEYYQRHGGNDQALIVSLFRDVLGTNPSPQQVQQAVHRLHRTPSRNEYVIEFLQANRPGGPAPQVVQAYSPGYVAPQPAPVYVNQPPVYVTQQPVYVAQPQVYVAPPPPPVYVAPVPVYRPAPVYRPGYPGYRPAYYPAPAPGVSIGVGGPNGSIGVNIR